MTIQTRWITLLALCASIVSCSDSLAQTGERISTFPGATWEIRTPQQVGLLSSKLATLSTLAGATGIIIKDGYQVFSWGGQGVKWEWMSAAKPVTSTLLMFAVDDGQWSSVDALIGPLIQQEFGTPLSSKDSLMTFAHLANMTSGYALPSDPGPGTRWGYNDYAIKLYNRLLANRVFGAHLNDVITHPSRLGPLQFQDGTIYSTRFGYGVYTTPRDFARIGWFWLNRGYWDGTQLLSDSLFDPLGSVGVATSIARTDGGLDDYLGVGTYGGGTDQTGSGPGIYGFNSWLNTDKAVWPDAPADTYQANGGWNRFALTVIPSLKMVAAWTAGESQHPDSFAVHMNPLLKLLAESAEISISVPSGWNQVSVPVKASNMSVVGLFGNTASPAFRFENGRYVRVDTLKVGAGYLLSSEVAAPTLSGEHVLPQRVQVSTGWNLVGVFHNSVAVTSVVSVPANIIDSAFLEKVGEDQLPVSSLLPGKAYWVRVKEDGYLHYKNDP